MCAMPAISLRIGSVSNRHVYEARCSRWYSPDMVYVVSHVLNGGVGPTRNKLSFANAMSYGPVLVGPYLDVEVDHDHPSILRKTSQHRVRHLSMPSLATCKTRRHHTYKHIRCGDEGIWLVLQNVKKTPARCTVCRPHSSDTMNTHAVTSNAACIVLFET